MLADAEAIAHDLKRAGDLLVGSYYNTLGKSEQETLRRRPAPGRTRRRRRGGAMATTRRPGRHPALPLAAGVSRSLSGRGPVGFDGFVGNPPFIGGRRIRETLGDTYRNILYNLWPDPVATPTTAPSSS